MIPFFTLSCVDKRVVGRSSGGGAIIACAVMALGGEGALRPVDELQVELQEDVRCFGLRTAPLLVLMWEGKHSLLFFARIFCAKEFRCDE